MRLQQKGDAIKQVLDGKRLLVIDDGPTIMALSSHLRLLGATAVLSAGDGARAWECIEQGFQPELDFQTSICR